jgi:hypothetical protein
MRVDQHNIHHNLKTGNREPVSTVKNYKSNTYAHKVAIPRGCVVKYSLDSPPGYRKSLD